MAQNTCNTSHRLETKRVSWLTLEYMSLVMRKPTLWFPNRSYTNRAVQAQKIATGWKFGISKVLELYCFAVTAKRICAFVFA